MYLNFGIVSYMQKINTFIYSSDSYLWSISYAPDTVPSAKYTGGNIASCSQEFALYLMLMVLYPQIEI